MNLRSLGSGFWPEGCTRRWRVEITIIVQSPVMFLVWKNVAERAADVRRFAPACTLRPVPRHTRILSRITLRKYGHAPSKREPGTLPVKGHRSPFNALGPSRRCPSVSASFPYYYPITNRVDHKLLVHHQPGSRSIRRVPRAVQKHVSSFLMLRQQHSGRNYIEQ